MRIFFFFRECGCGGGGQAWPFDGQFAGQFGGSAVFYGRFPYDSIMERLRGEFIIL